GAEAAMVYSNMSQLCMLGGDMAGTLAWGGRAIGLAERLEETEILIHAPTNVNAAELAAGAAEGEEKVLHSLALALEAGYEEHVARAYTNLACTFIEQRPHERAERVLEAGGAHQRPRGRAARRRVI